MTVSFAVTKRTCTLGAADPTTGLYAKTFTEDTTDQEMIIVPKGWARMAAGFNFRALQKYDYTGLAVEPYLEDDEVIDAAGRYYRVLFKQHIPWGDSLIAYTYGLAEVEMHADDPTTSGTWHLDSDSAKTEPRYRQKSWLDTYLSAAAILENDGATQASWITTFDEMNYSLKRVFITKGVDAIFSLGKSQVTPLYATEKKLYAFEESCPITIYALNKTGITASNLVEQCEQEIRHVATDHPTGSLRSIEGVKHEPQDLGGMTMHSTTVTLRYKRANDDYTPTAPTFSNNVAFTYEGDRVTGGAEGTWDVTNHLGGSTTTFTIDESEKNLDCYCSVFVGDSFTHNGTVLGLSTTTYTKFRFRYKTTGSATAKIIVYWSDGGGGTQTVLAETTSLTWTTATVSLTAGHTLDEVRLYICDATGHVYYDFWMIYGNEYILPNVVIMEEPLMVNDVQNVVAGRGGYKEQGLGSGSLEVTMECDLDMEPSALTWKRPQTTASTDANKTDALTELLHTSGGGLHGGIVIGVPWVWLDLGDPAMQFKARLKKREPVYGESSRIRLTWGEYRHGTANNETASERYGLSL